MNIPLQLTNFGINGNISNITFANESIYFTANDGVSGLELWQIDINGQLSQVADINPGAESTIFDFLINVGGELYFSANDRNSGKELRNINSQGQLTIFDTVPGMGSSNPEPPFLLNNKVYFVADTNTGKRLWEIDPITNQSILVRDELNQVLTKPTRIWDINGVTYFTSRAISENSTPNLTDTIKLFRIDSNTGNAIQIPVSGTSLRSFYTNPLNVIEVNGTTYFTSNTTELWRIDPITGNASFFLSGTPRNFTNYNQNLYFTLNANGQGRELWWFNPINGNPELFIDINTGTGSSDPQNFLNVNGTLYFSANNGLNANGRELWKLDPNGNASLVQDIIIGNGNSNPANLTNVNGSLYFTSDTGVFRAAQWWRIDPITNNPVKVLDIATGNGLDYRGDLIKVRNSFYFIARDRTSGRELWKLDPSTGNASLVKNIYQRFATNQDNVSDTVGDLTNANGILYFTANEQFPVSGNIFSTGRELWQIDQTTGNAVLVEDINKNEETSGGRVIGSQDSNPDSLTYNSRNDTLYFTADNGTSREIYSVRVNSQDVLPPLDPASYLASNADLIQAFGSLPYEEALAVANQHYIQFGFNEGRLTRTFNPISYINSNLDLLGSFGNNPSLGNQHYIQFGFNEGRIDSAQYLASNPDLIQAFGSLPLNSALNAATDHYRTSGINEGRALDTFDEVRYLASNPDLITAFVNNTQAIEIGTFLATEQYIQFGLSENRSLNSFNPTSYLINNPDLLTAFGNDGEAAAFHYVQFGFNEGRPV